MEKPNKFNQFLNSDIGRRYSYLFLTYDIIFIVVVAIAIFTPLNASFISIIVYIMIVAEIEYFVLFMNSYRIFLKKQKNEVKNGNL